MNGDVGVLGAAVAVGLVVMSAGLAAALRLGLARSVLTACLRAAVQLAIVGAALRLVLAPGAWIGWSWLWVAVIVVFTAVTVARRAPQIPGVFGVALAATAVTALICLGAAFGLGMFPVETRTLVPVAGMTIGNSLTSMVVAAGLVEREVSQHQQEIEARLALALPWWPASRPFARAAMRASVSPQIERTRALGIVFLPGAMVGLILAGVDPVDAVLVQGALMFVILASVAVSTAGVVLLGTRALFTRDHRLRPIARQVA